MSLPLIGSGNDVVRVGWVSFGSGLKRAGGIIVRDIQGTRRDVVFIFSFVFKSCMITSNAFIDLPTRTPFRSFARYAGSSV